MDALKEAARKADIIFTATGCPDLITSGDLKKGSVVIDIGVCKDANKAGQVRGDICEEAKK